MQQSKFSRIGSILPTTAETLSAALGAQDTVEESTVFIREFTDEDNIPAAQGNKKSSAALQTVLL